MIRNELRYGNIIDSINRSGEVHIPRGFPLMVCWMPYDIIECIPYYEKEYTVREYTKVKPSDICGVRLTEEWLVKLGFDDDKCLDDWSYYIENNGEIVFKKSGLDVLYNNPIKHVNTLQNLYFALTQKELKINGH